MWFRFHRQIMNWIKTGHSRVLGTFHVPGTFSFFGQSFRIVLIRIWFNWSGLVNQLLIHYFQKSEVFFSQSQLRFDFRFHWINWTNLFFSNQQFFRFWTFSMLDIQMLLQSFNFKEPILTFWTINNRRFFNRIGVWINRFFWIESK